MADVWCALAIWSAASDNLGLFDLIIGSDLLHEDSHIALLANFIEAHAKPACEVVIVDPGRGRKNKLMTRMTSFGFTTAQQTPEITEE